MAYSAEVSLGQRGGRGGYWPWWRGVEIREKGPDQRAGPTVSQAFKIADWVVQYGEHPENHLYGYDRSEEESDMIPVRSVAVLTSRASLTQSTPSMRERNENSEHTAASCERIEQFIAGRTLREKHSCITVL